MGQVARPSNGGVAFPRGLPSHEPATSSYQSLDFACKGVGTSGLFFTLLPTYLASWLCVL